MRECCWAGQLEVRGAVGPGQLEVRGAVGPGQLEVRECYWARSARGEGVLLGQVSSRWSAVEMGQSRRSGS